MAEALKRPGGELASRPLHFFWVVDCSGSMYGEKIGTVNHAIQSTIPEMVDAAKDNPNAQLLVRTLKFSTGATWVTPDPVNIEDFAWDDLDAGGVTDLGKAFEMLAAQLTIPPMTDRALSPVIVLLSDGQPTDDYKKSLDKLLHLPWGKKAVRSLAYAIGQTEPVAVEIDTQESGYYDDAFLTEAVRRVFDFTPAGMIRALDLDKPFFAEVCNNCHFMHPQAAWEQTDKTEKLRMACAELEDERT